MRPSVSTVKAKLKEKYGHDIYITRSQLKETVVCFQRTGNRILTEEYYKKENVEEKRLKIVKTAAEIILEDICSQALDLSTYPPCAQFLDDASEQLPTSLKVLLEGKSLPLSSTPYFSCIFT